MAILKDEEEQQGQGTSQALGQGMAQPTPQQPQEPQSSTPSFTSSQPTQTTQPAPKQQRPGTGTFANLKSYLQAAQSGGQQKVAQAAAGQVQKLGAGAQKGLQQAQEAFGKRMEAGSLKGLETAAEEAKGIVGAARQATYQAPQAQQVTPQAEGATPSQPSVPAQPQTQQYLTPEQSQRFAEIINAQYQGPASLQQAGLYEQAAQKARTAKQAGELTQTAMGREQLLRDVFGRTRDYGRGVSKLDALLLNASQQGVEQLQQQAQPALRVQEALQQAQNISTSQAAQRAAAMEQIRTGAREAFKQARTEEEQSVESRIDKLVKEPAVDEQGNKIQKIDEAGKPVVDAAGNPVYLTEWERLPEYFRQSLAKKGEQTKAIQQELIADISQQYKPQIDEFNRLSNEKKSLEDESRRQQISWNLEDRRLRRSNRSLSEKDLAQRENIRNQFASKLNELNTGISSIQNTQEYKDYQQKLDQANKMNLSQWILSPEEAAVLGVSAGEGLYNIRPEDIRTVQAERGRLISKDELSRQLALAELAGTDVSQQLQKDLLYGDLEKAGTQDLTKSLDVEAFRRLLNEAQQGFKTAAEQATLTGTGAKKVSRGNWAGKKTSTYYANVAGNVADMLREAGYDVSKLEPGQAKSLLSDQDLLNRYLGATTTGRETEAEVGGNALEGAATGASLGTAIKPGLGTAVGAGVGAAAGANTLDTLQAQTDLAKELEQKLGISGLGAVGQGVQDVRSLAASPVYGAANIAGGNAVGDALRGIAGAIGGINTGAMKAYGEAIAKQGAIEDLQRKYAEWLRGQGFESRANIADTDVTRARTAALMDLLRRQS